MTLKYYSFTDVRLTLFAKKYTIQLIYNTKYIKFV